MSIESLGHLEFRVQNLIDKLELTRMEAEDLRTLNTQLQSENDALKQELDSWGSHVGILLEKLNAVADDEAMPVASVEYAG